MNASKTIGIVGCGTMGTGIAIVAARAGFKTRIYDLKPEPLENARKQAAAFLKKSVERGKLAAGEDALIMAQFLTTTDAKEFADCDLVIEAVFEDMGVKAAVFQALDRVMKPGAILASNTSTLDLNRIAACTQRPQDVVGLHFFSPANVMQLLEVVRGDKTAPDVLATVMALAKKIRKTAVVSGVCDGFIGNRMVEQYLRQAGFLLDEGCSPQQVDKAMEAFGMAMGPFRMSDLAGNDIGWAIRKRRAIESPGLRYSPTADAVCELGRFGQKTGAGWYDYVAGQRDALPSADVAAAIDACRRAQGIAPRKIGAPEIVQRLVFALVNEAAHILEEGIALRAGDIDIVYLYGYGFPAFRGGPMRYADELGLFTVAQTMQRFAANPHADPGFWQAAPLLARLAAAGKTFT